MHESMKLGTAESRFSDCKYSEYSWFSEGITADHFITVT